MRSPSDRPPGRRLAIAIGAILALTAAGSAGYVLIEGMALSDAVYMTVITLSTVGYGEVAPLSEAGRWYTLALIAVGLSAVFYAFGAIGEFLIEGRLQNLLGRRAMKRAIDALSGHVIICGFGRLGRMVAEKLEESGTDFVVVDKDPAVQDLCDELGHPSVFGSALDDSVLAGAGIARARAIVAATNSDPDNVFITLSARESNPEIQVHARAETAAGIRRLRLAGASQVISPHQLGGQRIANAIVRPAVVEFLELSSPGAGAEIDLEEVVLPSGSEVDGVALRDLPPRAIRVSVIAIKRGDEPIRFNPGPDAVLRAGDRVIVVGDRENLNRLSTLVSLEPSQDVWEPDPRKP